MARVTALKKMHALEEQQQKLKMQREQLELELELLMQRGYFMSILVMNIKLLLHIWKRP